ncbi:acylphosphatase [Lactobacillus sp. ESL0701]|uniref:acylphosphatase n=1 Tax=Lactobacillus sp. ESL0701 TaxID=2983217 RepID=UPI0023F95E0A|nr:acylphosphatase [Lactobacillus sp. ESL0701]MDF7672888.1 acylphosphatase [Lactobacillus sp. ESL0701]
MGFFNRNNHSHRQTSANSTTETWEITVSGIVQGVGFRWSVQVLADKMQLTGSVHNNSDRTVTIMLQADLNQINQFCQELPHNISQFAKITKIRKEKRINVSKMHGFHVLY